MRGDEQRQAGFIVMTTLEDVVPVDHPLRAIRAMVDAALEQMSPELEALYASAGRPSVAPEYLLRAQLVQILLRGSPPSAASSSSSSTTSCGAGSSACPSTSRSST